MLARDTSYSWQVKIYYDFEIYKISINDYISIAVQMYM